MARLCGESSCSYSGRSASQAVVQYGSRTEARLERGGRATEPYGLAAARHPERVVVKAQKSAEVVVVAAVKTGAAKDRTSRNREELCAARPRR